MKRLLLLAIFILSICNLFAQENISITLRDGSVIEGNGRIKINGKILLKKSENNEREVYDYKEVKELKIYNTAKTYRYKIDGENGDVKLLEVIAEGDWIFYLEDQEAISYMLMGAGPGMTSRLPVAYNEKLYYVGKPKEDLVQNIGSNTHSKKFRNLAADLFIACPDLLKRIKAKSFKRHDMGSVIEYFSGNCLDLTKLTDADQRSGNDGNSL